jgi:fructose-specific component phosphotransferase system IIB-like protein
MQQNDESRRSFLKQVLAGSAVAAGATLTGKKVQALEISRAKVSDEILYRESDDFKKYYDSLR